MGSSRAGATPGVLAFTCCLVASAGCGGSGGKHQEPATPSGGLRAPGRDESCPRTSGGPRAEKVAIVIGHGPAYAALGMAEAPPAPGGVVLLRDDKRRGRYYEHKLLWAIRPGTETGLAVRGREHRGTKKLLFLDQRNRVVPRVRLGSSANDWTYAPMTVLIPGGGCFDLVLRGAKISEVLTFSSEEG
jgi:hypothetical protein